MNQKKHDQSKEVILRIASEFININKSKDYVVTVCDVNLTEKRTSATILVSVFPSTKENEALAELEKNLTTLTQFMSKKIRMQRLPLLKFEIDKGEKNRQKIEALLEELSK